MSELTACADARHRCDNSYCSNCDLLVGLGSLHVVEVERGDDWSPVRVMVESAPGPMGCVSCGVIASSHGRRSVRLVDSPCFGRPTWLIWRKRTWRCAEPDCPTSVFTEQDADIAAPRALLTARACWWAIGQIRRENAAVSGVARQLGTTWNTVWSAIRPLLELMDADESRFAGVVRLGVDEHVWHHVDQRPIEAGGRGPKMLTGMVDLTPRPDGTPHARLLDLVPGRSGKAYAHWLAERGQPFRDRVEVATLDPFHGYKNAIEDQLDDAVAVLDAFHVVKLGSQALDEVRRRVQQSTRGHRGRKGDPLYGIRTILRCGAERLTDQQRARLRRAIEADIRHDEVYVAWQCAQQLRTAYKTPDTREGRRLAELILASFPTCPIPEIKRLGKTLQQWKNAFLSYFDTGRANNGATEAVNNLIELQRRIARGFRNRDNYRLRMLLIAGGLTHPHLK